MPADPHPAVPAFEGHDDQSMIALAKAHYRLTVADAAYVRATDLSGQFGGIFLSSIEQSFDLDNTSTDADDGFNVIIDGNGNHWVRQQAITSRDVEKLITAAGDVVLADDESADVIAINKLVAAPTIVYLPSAAVRNKPITIVDKKGDAGTNNITVRPKAASGQKLMGSAADYVIDSNGASIKLRPYTDGSGYY
jgi:hypothetical protein